MKKYDLIQSVSLPLEIGIVLTIKNINGMFKKAIWVLWYDGEISWTTENRVVQINENR
jgi:hypothetical protein